MSIQYHIKPFVELKPIELCVILRAFVTSFFILFFSISVLAKPDTTIQNIQIYFTIKPENIPKNWVNAINAGNSRLVSLSDHKKSPVLGVLNEFIHIYPIQLTQTNLKSIYILDTIISNDQMVGGKANHLHEHIICMYRDSTPEYTRKKLLNTLHHEFSHIIQNKYYKDFPFKVWHKHTKKKYGRGGDTAIKKGKTSKVFDEALCSKGFLYEYALASNREDFASFAENLFLNNQEFWTLVDKYPLIKAKKDLTIQFYHSLDPIFTEEYFKNLPVIS
jgi:hypothetical protein